MQKKVLVAGGHVTPALAVMAELKKRGWEIVYIGRSKALEGENTPAQEMQEVKRLGYRFVSITTGRLQRTFTRHTLPSLLKIPLGFIQALSIITANKPHTLLSFGGYVAVPLVFWSWVMRIPVVTHEQTLSPGIANKIIGFFATKICLGFAEVAGLFPKSKTVVTGNPLRRDIFQAKNELKIPSRKPVAYITGGNLGAHSINQVVEEVLEKLLTRYTIVHQCGASEKYQDFERLAKKRVNLPQALAKNYLLFTFLNSSQIGDVFKNADIIVTRAGANITTEIIAMAKLALFIPLPWAGQGEQEKNAEYLTSRGAGRMMSQTGLTGEILLGEIDKSFDEKEKIVNNLKSLQGKLLTDADKRVADVLESVS